MMYFLPERIYLIVPLSHKFLIKAHRNREIMKSRFIDGLTYEELAEKYDLSTTMIKNIVYHSVDMLADYIM